MMLDTFSDLDPDLELEICRVIKLAKTMRIRLSIVSRMLILEKEGEALVISPMPRSYAAWSRFRDWHLNDFLHLRAYRRRSMDYGEKKRTGFSGFKMLTRRQIYAQWDKVAKSEKSASPRTGPNVATVHRLLERLKRVQQSEY